MAPPVALLLLLAAAAIPVVSSSKSTAPSSSSSSLSSNDTTPAAAAAAANSAHLEFAAGPTCAGSISAAVATVNAAGCTVRTQTDTQLFCGFSFACPPADSLASSVVANISTPIVNSYPVRPRLAPEAVQSPDSADSADSAASSNPDKIHSMTGVNDARAKLGLTGKGIKVAIIDSGVYYKHAALGGCFGPGCKVAFGFDLIGETFSAGNLTLNPDSDPIDNCSALSHGTHVAGIVAGDARNITDPQFYPNFEWTGVAPDATLGAYRVFDCNGFTLDDVVTAAIYRAAADGADIINLSLGGGPSFPDEPIGVAVTRVSAAGVIVAGAAGNDAGKGFMQSSNPAGALGAFSIGSFDNAFAFARNITIDGVSFGSWGEGIYNSSFKPGERLEIFVNNPDAKSKNVTTDGCSSVDPRAQGKTVLLRGGKSCTATTRCDNAKAVGAKACLIYDAVGNDPLIGKNIPTAAISAQAALAILNGAKNVTLDFYAVPIATGGKVSVFSSPGLDAELHIKPDLGAIGGQVYSSLSPHAALRQGRGVLYGTISGTSMATPYFAGAVALYLQARGKTGFDAIRTAFQNTARPSKMASSDLVAPVPQQGAGLLNVYDALTSKTVVSPSVLALNDTQFTSKTHYTLTLSNNHDVAVTYTVSHIGAATVNMYNGNFDTIANAFATTFTSNYATLAFGNNHEPVFTTVVPAGASTKINVKVTQPDADASLFPLFSGFVRVNSSADPHDVVTIPYAGMVGKWKDAHVLALTPDVRWNYPSGFYGIDPDSPTPPPLQPGGAVRDLRDGFQAVEVCAVVASTTRLLYAEARYAGDNQTVKNALNALGIGHDPRHSLGVLALVEGGQIGQGIEPPLPETAPFGIGQVGTLLSMYWTGYVVKEGGTAGPLIRLPPGDYTLRLKAMRHMTPGRYLGDENYQIIESPIISITY
ncbi:peptidase S8/S53 domain-containing protein [Zopfochytrium polystomum]|nr:peptidase S8/S53 domain-containing protein [Zopfochytrium polystomum]